MNVVKVLTYVQLVAFVLLIILLVNDVYKLATNDCGCNEITELEKEI